MNLNKYSILRDVHFKAYYFIYAEDYYESKGISFSGIELKRVRNFADEASGIRLYRNHF